MFACSTVDCRWLGVVFVLFRFVVSLMVLVDLFAYLRFGLAVWVLVFGSDFVGWLWMVHLVGLCWA